MLAGPVEDQHAAVPALLVRWVVVEVALTVALGISQRAVQCALDPLAAAGSCSRLIARRRVVG